MDCKAIWFNTAHLSKGFIYLEMWWAEWGLPQAGILANKLLWWRLFPHRYYKCNNTPRLWKHIKQPTSFTLVVDNFGVNFVVKEHADTVIFNMVHKTKIRTHWRLEQGPLLQYQIEMWLRHKNGGLIHARIHKKVLHKYKHDMMSKPQHCPYTLVPNNMAQRHRPPSQSTSPPNYHRTKYKSYNEWSEASYIMLVL